MVESLKDYKRFIQQPWIRNYLQTYELFRRLKDDLHFRGLWVENEIERRIKNDPNLDEAELRDILLAYLNEFSFKIGGNKQGKPSVHIAPKTFRNQPYSAILGISSRNLSTCLNAVIDSAVNDVLKGYGKGSVLSAIFGNKFGTLFNAYVVKRMQREFGK